MARYTGANCKLCRREGCKLYLKGERCTNGKCAFDHRSTAPGQHGAARKKVGEYGKQLREKQKARRYYGVLEGQFKHYYELAEKMDGIVGVNLLVLLESRLDNVVYRMGIAPSRTLARQIVNHAHISVNGKTVTIPSYIVKAGDVVCVKENRKGNKYFTALKETAANNTLVKWVEFDREKLEGKVLALPTREDIDSQIAEHMIVELYSK